MSVTKVNRGREDAQQALDFRRDKNGQKRGGARLNAGRPAGPKPAIRHRARPRLRKGTPVHVTLRIDVRLPAYAGAASTRRSVR